MAALVTYVAVQDDDGVTHSFGPDSDVPDWAKRKITNEKVWDDYDPDAVKDPEPAGGDPQGPPPQSGKGSGEDKWRAYAEQQGVDVSDVEGRDEIIDRLEAEGKPVE